MNTKAQLVINALEKELKFLAKKKERTAIKYNEYMQSSQKILELHREYMKIIHSNLVDKKTLARLKILSKEDKKQRKISNQDFMALMDASHDAEHEFNLLSEELAMVRFQYQTRGRL